MLRGLDFEVQYEQLSLNGRALIAHAKHIANGLASLLSAVRTPGEFHASGTADVHWPALQVEGVGLVALPTLPVQAEQLIAVAQQAPFGRGEETLVDIRVRRTWQIGADRVGIAGRRWASDLAGIVARVASDLGVTATVLPELYKLLVYDEGCFFLSHRDTEKSPGMFATLLVALPSTHSGGELIVRHNGREVRLALQANDPAEAAYAAFYADCTHEVLPVTSGCRLVLVYNLIRKGRGRLPELPDYRATVADVAALLQFWSDQKRSDDNATPDKLVYPLAHAYTPAEISFATLKGADAGAAAVLTAAARQAGCDAHVALLTIEETGSAEQTGFSHSHRWRRGRYDESDEDNEDDDNGDDYEDDFEVGEVCDRSLTLTHWQRPDGQPAAWGEAPFKDEEICPAEALQDLEFDDQFFHEATGNEGASFERTYQRAALVLWPQHRRLAVLCQAGVAATLPHLADLVRRWAASGEGKASELWQQAHELVGHLLRCWPRPQVYSMHAAQATDASVMLRLLAKLGDVELTDRFLSEISAAGGHAKLDTPALLKAAQLLVATRQGELLERIVVANALTGLGTCADLLLRAARLRSLVSPLQAAARSLVASLPGDPKRKPVGDYAWHIPAIKPDDMVDLILALWRIDTSLSERLVAHLLAWPKTFGLDAVILPALRRLVEQPELRTTASGQSLLAAGLDHLHARTSQSLEPPRDWSRTSTVECHCSRCTALARFLASPLEQAWSYKANQADRSHLASSIQMASCDVDVSTDQRGRPFSLVCTKNQASYERRVAQRKSDGDDLALLRQVGGE